MTSTPSRQLLGIVSLTLVLVAYATVRPSYLPRGKQILATGGTTSLCSTNLDCGQDSSLCAGQTETAPGTFIHRICETGICKSYILPCIYCCNSSTHLCSTALPRLACPSGPAYSVPATCTDACRIECTNANECQGIKGRTSDATCGTSNADTTYKTWQCTNNRCVESAALPCSFCCNTSTLKCTARTAPTCLTGETAKGTDNATCAAQCTECTIDNASTTCAYRNNFDCSNGTYEIGKCQNGVCITEQKTCPLVYCCSSRTRQCTTRVDTCAAGETLKGSDLASCNQACAECDASVLPTDPRHPINICPKLYASANKVCSTVSDQYSTWTCNSGKCVGKHDNACSYCCNVSDHSCSARFPWAICPSGVKETTQEACSDSCRYKCYIDSHCSFLTSSQCINGTHAVGDCGTGGTTCTTIQEDCPSCCNPSTDTCTSVSTVGATCPTGTLTLPSGNACTAECPTMCNTNADCGTNTTCDASGKYTEYTCNLSTKTCNAPQVKSCSFCCSSNTKWCTVRAGTCSTGETAKGTDVATCNQACAECTSDNAGTVCPSLHASENKICSTNSTQYSTWTCSNNVCVGKHDNGCSFCCNPSNRSCTTRPAACVSGEIPKGTDMNTCKQSCECTPANAATICPTLHASENKVCSPTSPQYSTWTCPSGTCVGKQDNDCIYCCSSNTKQCTARTEEELCNTGAGEIVKGIDFTSCNQACRECTTENAGTVCPTLHVSEDKVCSVTSPQYSTWTCSSGKCIGKHDNSCIYCCNPASEPNTCVAVKPAANPSQTCVSPSTTTEYVSRESCTGACAQACTTSAHCSSDSVCDASGMYTHHYCDTATQTCKSVSLSCTYCCDPRVTSPSNACASNTTGSCAAPLVKLGTNPSTCTAQCQNRCTVKADCEKLGPANDPTKAMCADGKFYEWSCSSNTCVKKSTPCKACCNPAASTNACTTIIPSGMCPPNQLEYATTGTCESDCSARCTDAAQCSGKHGALPDACATGGSTFASWICTPQQRCAKKIDNPCTFCCNNKGNVFQCKAQQPPNCLAGTTGTKYKTNAACDAVCHECSEDNECEAKHKDVEGKCVQKIIGSEMEDWYCDKTEKVCKKKAVSCECTKNPDPACEKKALCDATTGKYTPYTCDLVKKQCVPQAQKPCAYVCSTVVDIPVCTAVVPSNTIVTFPNKVQCESVCKDPTSTTPPPVGVPPPVQPPVAPIASASSAPASQEPSPVVPVAPVPPTSAVPPASKAPPVSPIVITPPVSPVSPSSPVPPISSPSLDVPSPALPPVEPPSSPSSSSEDSSVGTVPIPPVSSSSESSVVSSTIALEDVASSSSSAGSYKIAIGLTKFWQFLTGEDDAGDPSSNVTVSTVDRILNAVTSPTGLTVTLLSLATGGVTLVVFKFLKPK